MIDLSIPILLLGVGMLVVVVALALVLRQLTLSRRRGSFECILQRRGRDGHGAWQHGLMRYGNDRLLWFRAASLRATPHLVIARSEIQDVHRTRLPARTEGGAESYLLEFSLRGGRQARAIVGLVPGAALNSWLEAAPTGLVRGDAD